MPSLPIKKAVLYKHGVGYFERVGEIEGDAAVDLHFRATEMNDVLKSLTTIDLDGGRISSMSYESTLPVEKQLENLSVRLSGGGSLSSMLEELKGARVRVEIGGRAAEGSVAGVQWIDRLHDSVTTKTPSLVLLLEGGVVQTFDLTEIKQLTFLDEAVRNDLAHLLEILIGAKKKDLKKLTIFARGEGTRRVLAGYIIETPVWKTSYRVLLDEGNEPLLQGWALVDNTQDEDLIDVSLSLVAGLPISFVHDLYSPRYKRRPVVNVQEEEAYAPPLLEEPVVAYAAMPAAAPAAEMMDFREEGGGGAMKRRGGIRARRTVEVQTRTVEVSDLFQYDIEKPVTVRRGESALVPILQGPFEGRRIAIYSRAVREKNPMSALMLKNTTGLTLEGGPLTVFENGSYVGESMLENMQADEERIVPFSVELGCLITVDSTSESQSVSHVIVHDGVVLLESARLQITMYNIRSKIGKPLDLVIEHPKSSGGATLVDTPDPFESTENNHRFRLEIAPRAALTYTVRERAIERQSVYLLHAAIDQIEALITARYFDARTSASLARIVERQRRVSTLQELITSEEGEINEIFKNQERLRKNLQSLGASTDEKALRERYVGDLAADEDRLTQLRAVVKNAKQELREEQRLLGDETSALEFDAAPTVAVSS